MKRNRRLLLFGLVMAMLGGIAPVIHAATVTTTLPVTATVGAVCTVSASGVNFGSFTGAAVNANGSITVTCPTGMSYTVALNAGSHFGSSGVAARAVQSSGGGALAYRLFSDSALTSEWGDACGSQTYSAGGCITSGGTGGAQLLTVFGRLEQISGAPAAGSYSDTVVVTVSF